MNFKNIFVLLGGLLFVLIISEGCTSPVRNPTNLSEEQVDTGHYYECTFWYGKDDFETAIIKSKDEPILGQHGQVYVLENQDSHHKIIRTGVRRLEIKK